MVGNQYRPMVNPKDLYIITTARKRDTLEWDDELIPFLLSQDKKLNFYDNKVVIDSWNNIKKYTDVEDGFFIFDEQRLVGSGAWVKAFYKIAKKNYWILLSATPGDKWIDYIPVFVANGFYRNKTDFNHQHVIYSRYGNFPQITGYVNEKKLNKLRDSILVDIRYIRDVEYVDEDINVDYSKDDYKLIMKTRWNYETGEPIVNAAELCYTLRRSVNSHESRIRAVKGIVKARRRAIIFYNFNYELELLRAVDWDKDFEVAEWNGHKHEPVPSSENWVYLVQYTAGAEGWNCIQTDTIIFYSQNYSYKVMKQSAGRIDRRNTPYKKLYYYHLKSKAPIDVAISRALKEKKKFNEKAFGEKLIGKRKENKNE